MFSWKLHKSSQLKNNQILNTLQNVNQITIELNPKKSDDVRKLTQILSTQTHLEKVVLQLKYQLTQSSIYQLFNVLEKLPELKELGIKITGSKNLQLEEARQLGKTLKKLNNLTTLSLCLTDIEAESKLIALSLKKGIDYLTQLKDLNIELKYTKNPRMHLLLSELSNLTCLTLSFQEKEYSQRWCKKWSKSISNLSNLTSLKLTILGGQMESSGFGCITSNLYKLTKLETLEIQIEAHLFMLEDIEYLKLSLRQLNGLKSFSFQLQGFKEYQNQSQNILEAFESSLHNQLTTMSLSLPIQMSEDLGYFHNLSCLKELTLNLSLHKLTTEAIRSFFLGMRALVSLKKLKLTFKNFTEEIGQEIGRQFGMSLKRMVMLEDLYLEFPNTYKSGIKLGGSLKLGRGLSQLLNLKKLYLLINQSNEIGEEGFKSIGMALKKLTNLEKLDLSIKNYNSITSYGCQELFSGLSYLVRLVELRLDISNPNSVEFDIISLSLALQNLNLLAILNLRSIRVTSEKEALILQDCLSKLKSLIDFSLLLEGCPDSTYFPTILQGLRYSTVQKIDVILDQSKSLTFISTFEELLHLKSLHHLALTAHFQNLDKRQISSLKSVLKKTTNLKSVLFHIQEDDIIGIIHELLTKYLKSLVDIQIEGDYFDAYYLYESEEDDEEDEDQYDE